MSNPHTKVGALSFPILGGFVQAFLPRQTIAQFESGPLTGQAGVVTGTAVPDRPFTRDNDTTSFGSVSRTNLSDGNSLDNLSLGVCSLQPDAPRFQKYGVRGVHVYARQVATFDVHLKVGNPELGSQRTGDF
jgi:hypothetical protein